MAGIKTATKSEPHWLNKSAMAESLGISVQAFDKWGVNPIAKVGRSVYFTVQDVVANRVNHSIDKGQPNTTKLDPDGDLIPEGGIDFERYRLTKAQADAQELKNEINRQEVVPTDFATFALSSVAAEASGILDSLPLNLLRKHPELSRVQQENIKRELVKAQNALSRLSDKLPELLDDYIKTAVS